jgi:hypothetical protein
MKETQPAGRAVSVSGGPAQYEIRVAGVLDSHWAAWFNGFQISGQGEETVICGLLADQPALHGLLTKVRDLGLCLISVRRLDGLAGDEGRRGSLVRHRRRPRIVRSGLVPLRQRRAV